jgi:hypothetical protein
LLLVVEVVAQVWAVAVEQEDTHHQRYLFPLEHHTVLR